MRCIQLHSALLPLHAQLKHRQQQHQQGGTSYPIKLGGAQRQHLLPLRTKAMHNAFIVLGVTPPAKSGDISVLLQTGGVLLIAYVFSNFVVPIFITKYFGFDKVGEDEDDDDDLFKM